MPRFAGKGVDTGVPVTIERDRYVEGDTSAILEGILVLGEKPGSTVFPIQIDADGYLKIYLDGNATLQTEYEDDALNGTSKGTLTMGDGGVDLQNILVDINGYLQAVVVEGQYTDTKYQDGTAIGSPYGTVMMSHDESNVYPVVVGSDGYLQITRVEAVFSNSVADITLIATSTTQIVAALTTRLCTLINNKRTNTQIFRIGDANVNASRGAELAPGESISIETNGAIYGYNPGITESILVLLREEDDNPEPPAAPTLTSPINSTVIENTSVTFHWESSVGATNYQIRVSTDPNVETDLFHEDVTDGAISKNYTDFPNDGTIYYWKVRAYNATGWGDWSTIENFINGIEEEPPAAPILISPINGFVVSDTSVTFHWESSVGATNYRIRVSTDPNVEIDLFHDDLTSCATSKYYDDFPNDGTVYYWKVRAYNGVGGGSWSTIWHFTNEDDGVPIVGSGDTGYYDLEALESLFFKFDGYVPDAEHPIMVSSVSPAGEPKTVDMIIVRSRKPTLEDLDLAYTGGNCSHWHDDIGWYPSKPGTTELVTIYKPMGSEEEKYTFYIMLHNTGDERVRNQRLIATY
jgi:hypothetical protein